MTGSASDLFAELEGERDALLRDAVYLVIDAADERVLLALDYGATLQGQPIHAAAYVRACRASTVVICGTADPKLREWIRAEAPNVRVVEWVRESPAAALGDPRGIECDRWDDETVIARAETWLRIVREGARTEEVMRDNDTVVAFPDDALPVVCRRLVLEGSAALGVDPAFIGGPILGVLSGAIGAARVVEVKRGWLEPSVLWVVVSAASGLGKSPALDLATAPLRLRDAELAERTRLAFDDYKRRLSEWNRAQRRKDADASPMPEPPPRLAVVLDNATMEATIGLARDNPHGLVGVFEEAASWFAGFDAYRGGKGGDCQRWLGAFGARPIKVDRQGAGTIYVPRPCICIVGGAQPRVLTRALGREHRENGLAARLLVASPPASASRWTDSCVSTDAKADYRRVVSSLLDLSCSAEPVVLRLSTEARRMFRGAHDELAEAGALAAKAGDEDTAAAAAKLRSAIPRLALVLALAKAAEAGIAELLREVDAEAMRGAIQLSRYFQGQAATLAASWAIEDGDPLIGKVLSIIRAAGPDGVTRTALRDAVSKNYDRKRIDPALDLLRRNKLIEKVPTPKGIVGRPPETWRAL